MRLRRSPPMELPDGVMQVTVEVTIEIQQDDLLRSFYDTNQTATPLDPVLPLNPANVGSQPQPLVPSASLNPQLQLTTPFAEAALRTIAQNEMRGFHTMFTLPEPRLDRAVLAENAARLIWTDVNGLVLLGQQLLARETLDDHAKAMPTENIEINLPADYWMQRLEPLRNSDAPLFHMLRDSLHAHTPHHILLRWNALRKHMGRTGQTLANLVRQAEQLPRLKWHPLVVELYFLLLDHNETVTYSLSAVQVDTESLECQLSAYCTAVRIRFYLWRMTRPNPMCRLRTYKRHVKSECFGCYCKQLSSLVAQEFSRVQDPASGEFQNVGREIVGEPVDVMAISKPLSGTAIEFCTICQDMHPASDCVSPHHCACVFGRDCLQPLLNRDTPSSYACPNCRARLHEPLRWQPVEVTSERDLHIGLLWALRSNVVCLQREINADPDPFTPRQRVAGFFVRVIYGR